MSPDFSIFSVVVLVALSGVVSVFCSTVVFVSPSGVVVVVSVFFVVVAFGAQPIVPRPTTIAIARASEIFI